MNLLDVESLANPAPAVQQNFETLDAAVFHRSPTLVAGVANTRKGPPASGIRTWQVNEMWVDSLLSPWICVAAGDPGTWLQLEPAMYTSASLPASADISGYNLIHARIDELYALKFWNGSAWISSLFAGGTLGSALGIVAGAAATPGLYVSGDTNTGLFAPAADTLALTTGGTERVRVNGTGLVGLGNGITANFTLDVAGDIRIRSTNKLFFGGTGASDNDVNLYKFGTNRLATDDSFRVGVDLSVQGAGEVLGILYTYDEIVSVGEIEAPSLRWFDPGSPASAPTPITALYSNLLEYYGSNGTRWLGEPDYWLPVKWGSVVGRVPMFTV